MKQEFMFTSESVTEGHPDKLCDQISDAIVDHFLEQDPFSMVIAECAVSISVVFIAARFNSEAVLDFANVARGVIRQIGYNESEFNSKTCSILTSLKEMPRDEYCCFKEWEVSDEEMERIPVRNQATVFGFACNQTPALMPLPIWLAHKLSRRLTTARLQKTVPYLTPDGKVQVGVEYRSRRPHHIHSITLVASQSRPPESGLKGLHESIRENVIRPAFDDENVKPDDKTMLFINPYGPFFTGGGPAHHSGLTGRKNAIDTYGEYSRHSGAALSGKDPMRIDRIGAYAARYAAKNVVSAGLADECEVQLSYSIGLSRPVSVQVETFGTGKISDEDIAALLERHFDFRLAGILKKFRLRRLPAAAKGGFYRKLAAYGQVGRIDMDLPWEETDKATILREK
jgi:S-adenosylmethionine synthetase